MKLSRIPLENGTSREHPTVFQGSPSRGTENGLHVVCAGPHPSQRFTEGSIHQNREILAGRAVLPSTVGSKKRKKNRDTHTVTGPRLVMSPWTGPHWRKRPTMQTTDYGRKEELYTCI